MSRMTNLIDGLNQYIQDEWIPDIAQKLVEAGEWGILNINVSIRLGAVEVHKTNVKGPFITKKGEVDYDPKYQRQTRA